MCHHFEDVTKLGEDEREEVLEFHEEEELEAELSDEELESLRA
ncbi:hypothetical protein ACFQGT_07920 [Natrialbaceae archaeon GCM10025810]